MSLLCGDACVCLHMGGGAMTVVVFGVVLVVGEPVMWCSSESESESSPHCTGCKREGVSGRLHKCAGGRAESRGGMWRGEGGKWDRLHVPPH